MNVIYNDGTVEILEAGKPFVVMPGHTAEVIGDHDAVMIEYDEELEATLEEIAH